MSRTNDQFGRSSGALVTGAGGFVGGHLCRSLAERSWRVVAARRGLSEDGLLPGIRSVQVVLSLDADSWQEALKTVDCVIHLAGLAHQLRPSASDVSAFNQTNVEGSRFVAEQAVRAGVRRLIFVSSIKVNGEGGSKTAYQAGDAPNPRDPYAQSKLDAEIVLNDVCGRSRMELVIIRPPLIYGPGVGGNFRRLMSLAALGLPLPFLSIDNNRSLIGIWNLASFIETCMTHPLAAGEIWLVSDGEDLSTPMLLRKLSRLMGKPSRLIPTSPQILRGLAACLGFGTAMSRLCGSLRLDSTRARRRLNWTPPLSVDDGLARTVAAFLAQTQ